MRYELRSADGARLMRDRKTGFCLGDRYRVAYAFPDRPPPLGSANAAARAHRA